MDPITHALLGASTSQAFLGHKLGRKSMLFGALAAALPDIDIIPGMIYGSFVSLVVHRGPTHSLWFPFIVGPLLGYLIHKWYQRRFPNQAATFKYWSILFCLAILSHPLLDVFTSYGTQLFAPFSNHRFAINAIGVIDPAYTSILFISVMMGIYAGKGTSPNFKLMRLAACLSLILSTGYIFYGRILNQRAENIAFRQLEISDSSQLPAWQVQAYPTLLQLYGRRVVGRINDHVCVGFVSLWRPQEITWRCKDSVSNSVVDMVRKTPEGQIFEWFTTGMSFATVLAEKDVNRVKIYDLRFGLDEPDQGLWFIEGLVSSNNQLIGNITYKTRDTSQSLIWAYLKQILIRTFEG